MSLRQHSDGAVQSSCLSYAAGSGLTKPSAQPPRESTPWNRTTRKPDQGGPGRVCQGAGQAGGRTRDPRQCGGARPIWTPLQVTDGQTQEHLRHFGEETPFKRPGQPAELAATYVTLAMAESSYTTGQVYGVAGGKGNP
jgi:hypothetical protein